MTRSPPTLEGEARRNEIQDGKVGTGVGFPPLLLPMLLKRWERGVISLRKSYFLSRARALGRTAQNARVPVSGKLSEQRAPSNKNWSTNIGGRLAFSRKRDVVTGLAKGRQFAKPHFCGTASQLTGGSTTHEKGRGGVKALYYEP